MGLAAAAGGRRGAADQLATPGGRRRFESGWLDEHGRVFIATDQGLGLVHTLDMEAAAAAVESGAWPLTEIRFAELPGRFAFCLRPTPDR